MDAADNKQFILDFHLPGGSSEDPKYTRVLLQLFGYTGHGKSAFVNSCIYTLGEDEFQTHATTGSTETIITTRRNKYALTDTISIVENRGFGKKDGVEEAVTYAQLGHFLPLDEEVVLTKDFDQIMSQAEDSDPTPNYTDFIAPIFIYSARHKLPQEQLDEVFSFFMNCRDMTGVVPIVVLTHTFKNDYKDLEEKFRRAGAGIVLAIENYTVTDHMKTPGRCNDIQKVIVEALKDVGFRLTQPRDPKKERIQRKKVLLKCVHEFILTETKAKPKKEEYERLKALADKRWFKRFPFDN